MRYNNAIKNATTNNHKSAMTAVVEVVAFLVIALNILVTARPFFDYVPKLTVYIIDIAALGIALIGKPKFKIMWLLVAFCALSALSIVLNRPPAYFEAFPRFVFFMVMLCLLSPIISSPSLCRMRSRLWRWLIWLLQADILFSTVGYLPWLCFNYDNHWSFTGFFMSSMLTSIMGALVALERLWAVLYVDLKLGHRPSGDEVRGNVLTAVLRGNPSERTILTTDIVIVVAGLLMTFGGGSRAALLAVIFGSIPLLIGLKISAKRKILVFATFVALLVGAVFLPFGKKIVAKFEVSVKHESLLFSRAELWEARCNEFLESPVYGVGFCVSTHHSEFFDDPREDGTIISEPGSAWLSMLSNVGIVGFIVFVAFNVLLLRRLWKARRRTSVVVLYVGLLTALALHGFFEGWVLYAGSMTFIFYWLLTWRIYSLRP